MNRAASLSPFLAVLAAGAVAATIDIVYACGFHYAVNGISPERILHYIAAGLLGREAATAGGAATAALGLALHYFILIAAAGLYYAVSRRVRLLVERPAVAGVAFGLGIWLTMNFIVVPLSALGPQPITLTPASVTNFLVHVFVLGPVIAFGLRRLAR
jgi:hypothetical protein